MGAEESIIKSYDVDVPYDNRTFPKNEDRQNQPNITSYAVHPATHRASGSKVSVFFYNKSLESSKGASCAETLKLLRHPYVLKFIGAVQTDRHLKLITEDVSPLSHKFYSLEALEIISGLHNILEALVFLHEKVKLVHGNLNQYSVFVNNQDGTWKVGCMEKATKSDESGIKHDILCFAEMAKSLLDATRGEEEELFVHKLETLCAEQDLLNGTELKDLLLDPIFMNGYLETVKFLNGITMKSDSEKKLFFSQLGDRLRELNPETVAKKLLPKLMSKMILAEPFAEKLFIPHLWKFNDSRVTADYNAVLPKDQYLEYCVPLILKLLRSKQIHVRLILLKYISLFVPAIDEDVLEDDVLPLILIGLRDENDAIVTATFHGLACIVPILGGKVVVGGERMKYFFDNRPNLRGSKTLSGVGNQGSLDQLIKSKESRVEAREYVVKQININNKKALQKPGKSKSEENSDKVAGELDSGGPDEGMKPCDRQVGFSEPMERSALYESEAEWEGFEAVTSESESEEKFEIKEVKHMESKKNSLTTYVKEDLIHKHNEPSLPEETEVPPVIHKFPSRPALISRQQDSTKSTHSQRLGAEFEFDVEVKHEEPDFFADMQPDLAINKTVMVETNLPVVSSKFEAAGDQPEFGWDADDW